MSQPSDNTTSFDQPLPSSSSSSSSIHEFATVTSPSSPFQDQQDQLQYQSRQPRPEAAIELDKDGNETPRAVGVQQQSSTVPQPTGTRVSTVADHVDEDPIRSASAGSGGKETATANAASSEHASRSSAVAQHMNADDSRGSVLEETGGQAKTAAVQETDVPRPEKIAPAAVSETGRVPYDATANGTPSDRIIPAPAEHSLAASNHAARRSDVGEPAANMDSGSEATIDPVVPVERVDAVREASAEPTQAFDGSDESVGQQKQTSTAAPNATLELEAGSARVAPIEIDDDADAAATASIEGPGSEQTAHLNYSIEAKPAEKARDTDQPTATLEQPAATSTERSTPAETPSVVEPNLSARADESGQDLASRTSSSAAPSIEKGAATSVETDMAVLKPDPTAMDTVEADMPDSRPGAPSSTIDGSSAAEIDETGNNRGGPESADTRPGMTLDHSSNMEASGRPASASEYPTPASAAATNGSGVVAEAVDATMHDVRSSPDAHTAGAQLGPEKSAALAGAGAAHVDATIDADEHIPSQVMPAPENAPAPDTSSLVSKVDAASDADPSRTKATGPSGGHAAAADMQIANEVVQTISTQQPVVPQPSAAPRLTVTAAPLTPLPPAPIPVPPASSTASAGSLPSDSSAAAPPTASEQPPITAAAAAAAAAAPAAAPALAATTGSVGTSHLEVVPSSSKPASLTPPRASEAPSARQSGQTQASDPNLDSSESSADATKATPAAAPTAEAPESVSGSPRKDDAADKAVKPLSEAAESVMTDPNSATSANAAASTAAEPVGADSKKMAQPAAPAAADSVVVLAGGLPDKKMDEDTDIPLTPSSSPTKKAREGRIALILRINRELIRLCVDLQAKNLTGEAVYRDVAVRLQGNLGYLAGIADKNKVSGESPAPPPPKLDAFERTPHAPASPLPALYDQLRTVFKQASPDSTVGADGRKRSLAEGPGDDEARKKLAVERGSEGLTAIATTSSAVASNVAASIPVSAPVPNAVAPPMGTTSAMASTPNPTSFPLAASRGGPSTASTVGAPGSYVGSANGPADSAGDFLQASGQQPQPQPQPSQVPERQQVHPAANGGGPTDGPNLGAAPPVPVPNPQAAKGLPNNMQAQALVQAFGPNALTNLHALQSHIKGQGTHPWVAFMEANVPNFKSMPLQVQLQQMTGMQNAALQRQKPQPQQQQHQVAQQQPPHLHDQSMVGQQGQQPQLQQQQFAALHNGAKATNSPSRGTNSAGPGSHHSNSPGRMSASPMMSGMNHPGLQGSQQSSRPATPARSGTPSQHFAAGVAGTGRPGSSSGSIGGGQRVRQGSSSNLFGAGAGGDGTHASSPMAVQSRGSPANFGSPAPPPQPPQQALQQQPPGTPQNLQQQQQQQQMQMQMQMQNMLMQNIPNLHALPPHIQQQLRQQYAAQLQSHQMRQPLQPGTGSAQQPLPQPMNFAGLQNHQQQQPMPPGMAQMQMLNPQQQQQMQMMMAAAAAARGGGGMPQGANGGMGGINPAAMNFMAGMSGMGGGMGGFNPAQLQQQQQQQSQQQQQQPQPNSGLPWFNSGQQQ